MLYVFSAFLPGHAVGENVTSLDLLGGGILLRLGRDMNVVNIGEKLCWRLQLSGVEMAVFAQRLFADMISS
jgi:hypothetical protein